MSACTKSFSRSLGKLGISFALTCFAASALAAPITYTISGLVSGTLGVAPFTNAQITIVATGDTSNIPGNPDCGSPVICNSLSSVTFTINGVGSGTVTDAFFIFDNPTAPALGLERVIGGDWVDIDGPQFVTYHLATAIGPFTGTTHLGSPFGTVATTAGTLALTSNPDTFQAVLAGGPSPPTIAKAFGAASIPLNGSSSLSFTITNPNASTLTGVGVTDTLPAGLVVSTPNGLTGSCGGGTITATAGSGTVTLAGASLASSASCTFSVNVTGTTVGTKNNVTGAVTSVEGGTGLTASASVVVAAAAPPTIAKAFGAGSIVVGGTTSLGFTLTNPNASTLTGIGFSDTLPAGLAVSTPNGLAGTCGGGTITATAGSGSVSLSGASLVGSASCTFSVNVTSATSGTKVNVTGAVSSAEGGTGGTASASITVGAVGPPPPPTNIPTLQDSALLLLGLLILVTARIGLRRRPKR